MIDDRVQKGSLDDQIATSYGDRFIPRRFLLANCERNMKFAIRKPKRDVLNLSASEFYWRENTYIPTINFIMDMRNDRIFSLVDPVVKATGFIARRRDGTDKNGLSFDWPCNPRSKPFAYTDITFDLPDYDSGCEQNLVDWSSNGQIAFSFGHDVVIWQSKVDITMSFSVKCPRSLAYSPSGQFLAIGCKSIGFPVIEMWDVSHVDDFTAVSGKIFHSKYSDVLCIEWASSGKQLVCGTRYGTMYVLSVPELSTIRKIRKHLLPVTIIRFSPTMRYLASADSEGNVVIYNWNMCTVYLYVKSRRKLNVVFDWHPWTGVDLAISEDVPASIVLLHVPSKKIVAYYQQDGTRVAINSISFSRKTGELLVSTSSQGDASNPLKPWLMTPFRNADVATMEMKFNDTHMKCRNIIERTNGVLKDRWRCLLGARGLHYNPKKAIQIANVVTALHNIRITYKCNEVPCNIPHEDDSDPSVYTDSEEGSYVSAGSRIRNRIVNSL